MTFKLVRPPKSQKLPVVLSREEVRQVLGYLCRFHYRVCLTTIYCCGLRLGEGVQLQVADIDSGRLLLHVRQGKGAKDRYVPLPKSTLTLLRQQWQTHLYLTTKNGVTRSSKTASLAHFIKTFRSSKTVSLDLQIRRHSPSSSKTICCRNR